MTVQGLTTKEWQSIDNRIIDALQDPMTALNWIQTKPAHAGAVQSKYYKYNPLSPVGVGYEDFIEASDKLKSTRGIQNLVSLAQDTYLDFNQIDAGRNGDGASRDLVLDSGRAITNNLKEAIDELCYLGTGGAFSTTNVRSKIKKDIGVVGLFNGSGVNTLGANGAGAGTDDDLTAFKDITDYLIALMKAKLKEDGHYGEYGYAFVATPGVFAQLRKNRSANTDKSEWEYAIAENPDIVLWVETTKLLTAALSTSNQEAMMVDLHPDNYKLKYAYPVHKRLMDIKREGDAHFGMFFRGAIELKRPTAVCISVTLTTSTAW